MLIPKAAFKTYLFIYLKGRAPEREGGKQEGREGERNRREVLHLLAHSTNGPKEAGTSSGTPLWVQGPKHPGHLLLLQAISRELNGKESSWTSS